jgi:hypothetical protein
MSEPTSLHNTLEKDKAIQSSRAFIKQWVSAHLDSYLLELTEQLLSLSRKAASNDELTRILQTCKALEDNSQFTQQTFLSQIDLAFEYFLKSQPTAKDFTATGEQESENISLVDNADLEESIALGSMSRKASVNASEDLYALNQRLSALKGGTKVTDQENPVTPAVFCEAIQNAIQEIVVDNHSKLVVYKIFDSSFMNKLPKLYNLLNHHMESKGILPNLGYQVKKDPAAELADKLPEELQAHDSETSIANQVALIEAIQQIQLQLRQQRPPSTYPEIPLVQLINSIQQLQGNAGAQLSNLDTPQSVASSNLQSILKKTKDSSSKAKDVDSEVVEIVGLLFEYMLNDQQLPDSIKALLSYLHTPFIKVGLLDKDFFNHPQHPARQLLNALVAAGERWVEPHGKHKNDVFHKIKTVVQKVLDEFDNDIRFFSELALEFNHYLRQHARRIRLAEKRAMQAAKGENKLKEIRLKVETFLNKKTEAYKLPTAIHTLLYEPWSNYLCFNLLRYGSGSKQWHQATETVNDILWYGLVSSEWHDTTRVETLRHALPDALQVGFEVVGYDKTQSIELLIALHTCHQQQAEKSPTPYLPAKPVDIDSIHIDPQLAGLDKKDPLLQKLTALESGTWFIFNADDTKQLRRVKLAWSDPNTLHFMFVNRMGQQIAMKTASELVNEIRSGKTSVLRALEGKPFFEKALESALGHLSEPKSNHRI